MNKHEEPTESHKPKVADPDTKPEPKKEAAPVKETAPKKKRR